MTAKARYPPTSALILPLVLVFLPALVFYTILALWTVNLPLRDDYDTILGFANGLADRPALAEKIAFLLAEQSNEYKLFVLHGAVWLQQALTHHTNFRTLICLGDAFVVFLGMLLWTRFLPACADLRRRLIYFVPVSCLLFELRYQEAADWSTAALQHMPCLFFSFAAIYFVREVSRGKFGLAVACMALAICSSGNGFLLLPVGLLSLILARKYGRAFCWTGTSAACAAIYFRRYTHVNLQAKQSLAASLLQVHPLNFLLFLGSIAARPSLNAGILLGILICSYLIYLVATGSLGRVTSTAYCMLYLLLTALAVAVFRGNVDPMQISTSRYTIYSALVLILSWVLLLERREESGSDEKLPKKVLNLVVITSVLFAASTYVAGVRAIQRTNQSLTKGMMWFEHSQSDTEILGPIVPLSTDDDEQKEFEIRARQELTRSIALGVYTPPPF